VFIKSAINYISYFVSHNLVAAKCWELTEYWYWILDTKQVSV